MWIEKIAVDEKCFSSSWPFSMQSENNGEDVRENRVCSSACVFLFQSHLSNKLWFVKIRETEVG